MAQTQWWNLRIGYGRRHVRVEPDGPRIGNLPHELATSS